MGPHRNLLLLVLLTVLHKPSYGLSSADILMIDPESRQTVPVDAEDVDLEPAEDVEDKILELLGLPNTPRPSYKHLKSNAAPKFMMHLYKEIQKQDGLEELMPTSAPTAEELGPEFRNLTYYYNQNQKIEEVDVVISFDNHPGHTQLGFEHEADKRYYFKLDEVPDSELKDAEFRLYKTKSHHDYEHYFISVFRMDSPKTADEKFGLTMLDTLAVNSSYAGWLVFNVSMAMDSWMADNTTNQGLYIEAHSITGEEVLPHRVGIVPKHGEQDKQGFMVAFYKSLEPLSRKIAEIQRPLNLKTRSKRSAKQYEEYWDAPNTNRYSRRLCQRKHLYVTFKRLRFDSWIIAPDGFPAFYCEGECTFPLSSHMNATNHAIVQTLVSLIQPRMFPKACCAPKKLTSITVLYFDDIQKVVMKRYKHMVVQSCGCH